MEPFVDFGRELYVPWQLAEGKALFKDVGYFNGPVSPWWNALWFRIFGASIHVLTRVNLVLSLIFTVFLYGEFKKRSDPWTGLTAAVLFCALFVFPQLTRNNAFNYIAPYSHEMTHGIYLSFLTLVLFMRYRETLRTSLLVVSGMCFGVVFMLKPELWIALTGGIATAACVPSNRRHRIDLPRIRHAAVFMGAAAIPYLITVPVLSATIGLRAALSHACGAWRFVFVDSVSNSTFYRFTSGTDNIPGNFVKMVAVTAVLAVPPWIALRIQHRFRKHLTGIRAFYATAAALMVLGVPSILFFTQIPWPELMRSLPLLMLFSAGYCIRLQSRHPGTSTARKSSELLPFIVFGFLMLLKILLYARLYHYGFVLAMPATLILIRITLDLIPSHLSERRCGSHLYRTVILILIACIAAGHLRSAYAHHIRKFEFAGSGSNRFVTDQRGRYLTVIVQAVEKYLSPEDTLAVLPQGAVINFLTGHGSPVRQVVYMPTEIAMYGEAELIRDFSRNPPDYIILRDRSTAEHGLRFGRDYAAELVSWIQSHTVPVAQIIPPSPMGYFGVQLLRTQSQEESTP